MSDLQRLSELEADAVRAMMAEARSAATRRAYASDVRAFVGWCQARGVPPLPATTATLLAYLVSLHDRRRLATINRAVVAVGLAHTLAGHADPRGAVEVREFLKGLRRRMRDAPKSEAPPMMLSTLRAVVGTQPATRRGVRNRAVLLIGWFGALRRSEVAALDVADVRVDVEGLVLRVRSSKTDQEGQGAVLGLPARRDELCPVKAFEAWSQLRESTSPALFVSLSPNSFGERLSAASVGSVVREAAVAADVPNSARYSGHSLRAGFATQAARSGKPAHAIRKQTRHRSTQMLERYIREGEVFVSNAADL